MTIEEKLPALEMTLATIDGPSLSTNNSTLAQKDLALNPFVLRWRGRTTATKKLFLGDIDKQRILATFKFVSGRVGVRHDRNVKQRLTKTIYEFPFVRFRPVFAATANLQDELPEIRSTWPSQEMLDITRAANTFWDEFVARVRASGGSVNPDETALALPMGRREHTAIVNWFNEQVPEFRNMYNLESSGTFMKNYLVNDYIQAVLSMRQAQRAPTREARRGFVTSEFDQAYEAITRDHISFTNTSVQGYGARVEIPRITQQEPEDI